MADSKNNPGDLFGQMLTQWETLSNQMANNLMSSSEYGKGQGALMAASLKMRETMHEQMTRFLEAANMPSREDIIELREAVAKLDAKMDRIELKLKQGTGNAPAATAVRKGPPRTRKPANASSKAPSNG